MEEENGSQEEQSSSVDLYILVEQDKVVEAPMEESRHYNARDNVPPGPIETQNARG